MKFEFVERANKDREGVLSWKNIVITPFLLGLAFGTGCYVAKVIMNSPLMSRIVTRTAERALQK